MEFGIMAELVNQTKQVTKDINPTSQDSVIPKTSTDKLPPRKTSSSVKVENGTNPVELGTVPPTDKELSPELQKMLEAVEQELNAKFGKMIQDYKKSDLHIVNLTLEKHGVPSDKITELTPETSTLVEYCEKKYSSNPDNKNECMARVALEQEKRATNVNSILRKKVLNPLTNLILEDPTIDKHCKEAVGKETLIPGENRKYDDECVPILNRVKRGIEKK